MLEKPARKLNVSNKYLDKIAGYSVDNVMDTDPPNKFGYDNDKDMSGSLGSFKSFSEQEVFPPRHKRSSMIKVVEKDPQVNLDSVKKYALHNPTGTRTDYDAQVKIAAEDDNKLRPHQERALKKLDKSHGVILAHGTGTGKTMTFLTALERAQKKDKKGRSLIVAPASLTTNIDKEIEKHNLKINLDKVDVMSYEKATIDSEKLKKNKYILAIADEAHKLRNPGTQRHTELSDIIQNADNRILATATSSYNHIVDTAPLINIAAGGKKVLPEDKKVFEENYVQKHTEIPPFLKRIFGARSKEISSLKNKDDLRKRLTSYVDY